LALGATACSSIGVQKMTGSWTQVLAAAAVIALYVVLAAHVEGERSVDSNIRSS
jgi:hypothetical protein